MNWIGKGYQRQHFSAHFLSFSIVLWNLGHVLSLVRSVHSSGFLRCVRACVPVPQPSYQPASSSSGGGHRYQFAVEHRSNQRPPPLLVFTSKGKTERGLQLWGSPGREGRLAPSTGNLWTGGLSERYRRSRSHQMELLQCSSYEILTVVFWDHFSRGLNSYLLYRISLLTVL